MIGSLALVAVGLVALLAGGDILVRGAKNAALRLGMSPFVVGVVLVGFGTSMPELFTSVRATLAGAEGIAVGNVIGSNIANILLILGVAVAIQEVRADFAAIKRDALALLLISALGSLLLITNASLSRLEGVVLLCAFVAAIVVSITSRTDTARDDLREPPGMTLPIAFGLALLGLLLTLFGAGALVDGGTTLAQLMGVSEAVIGLTVVAVGTSLPELAATLSAARKGEGAMALGNVLGSNIFNMAGILGVAALVAPLSVAPRVLTLDIWAMLGATAVFVVLLAMGRIGRPGGLLLLALYLAYMASMTL